MRDAAITLIANLMDICFVPQVRNYACFDKQNAYLKLWFLKDLFHQVASEKGSGGLFGHRAWKFREAACLLLIVTLRRFGSGALPDNKYIPSVCKLVTDKNTKVRFCCILKCYFTTWSWIIRLNCSFETKVHELWLRCLVYNNSKKLFKIV